MDLLSLVPLESQSRLERHSSRVVPQFKIKPYVVPFLDALPGRNMWDKNRELIFIPHTLHQCTGGWFLEIPFDQPLQFDGVIKCLKPVARPAVCFQGLVLSYELEQAMV